MLNRLHLINFRRHVDTELTFSPDMQIIAITGNNGAGKTTILEAFVYGLYGEGRQGRRNLARMVRRGAEHEGMQVEIGFNVGDVEYEVVRRHEKGKTSATLMANGNLVMQSPDGVTAEITKIFGMDSTGFRLAVVAQQFDVDGLADMTPIKRRQTITRLLRQDAVTRAKGAAADEKNRQLAVVQALGSGPDMDELEAELEEVLAEVTSSQAAVTESEAALAQIDKELAGTSKTRSQWQEAQIAAARADATLTASRAEADRLSTELDSIHVPDEPTEPDVPLARIQAELSEVNIAVSKAESSRELARVADQTRAEIVTIDASLTRVEATLDGQTPASLAMSVATIGAKVTAADADLTTARTRAAEVTAARVSPAGELAALRSRAAKSKSLGDHCDACDQPISEEHKHTQAAARQAREAELVAELADIDSRAGAAAEAVRVAEEALFAARSERDQMGNRRQIVESALAQRKELTQRKETYVARLERMGETPVVDVDVLYARKGELEVRKGLAEQYEQVLAVRRGALERAGRVATSLQEALARVEQAQGAKDAATPSPELAEAHSRVLELEQRRSDELEMVAAVRTEVATAQEREVAVRRRMAGAREQLEKLRTYRSGADRAAKTARLLDVTAERMATQIRPALEGAISDALNRLSEGRFTAVELSDSYEITVFDDGKYQPLTELSGGERVLVALATRLALAQVVSGRHASGGVGVLVLDEVFGSQDGERREAIMGALRALRAEYGQILLISHVGGLEEAADHVIDVSIRLDEGVRVSEVSVA